MYIHEVVSMTDTTIKDEPKQLLKKVNNWKRRCLQHYNESVWLVSEESLADLDKDIIVAVEKIISKTRTERSESATDECETKQLCPDCNKIARYLCLPCVLVRENNAKKKTLASVSTKIDERISFWESFRQKSINMDRKDAVIYADSFIKDLKELKKRLGCL